MPSSLVKTGLAVSALIVAAAWPAHAQTPPPPTPAPTLVSARACFSPITGAQLTGQGWTPGGIVKLTGTYSTGEPARDFEATADAAGAIRFESGLDYVPVTRTVTVTAEDRTRVAAGAPLEQRQASVTFKLTWYGPFYAPWNTDGAAIGRPGRVRNIEASGYLEGNLTDTLYAHYIRLTGREQVKTVKVGKLAGACGGLKKRFREFAFRPVARGTYRVTFDTDPFSDDNVYDAPGYERVKVRRRVR